VTVCAVSLDAWRCADGKSTMWVAISIIGGEKSYGVGGVGQMGLNGSVTVDGKSLSKLL
jgi:hypothetical protein